MLKRASVESVEDEVEEEASCGMIPYLAAVISN